jgi:hypothetical protein
MQKNRRARLEVKIEEQTRERDCSHDQYPPTEDVACDELSAASPVESRLHRTHLIGPHRWGGNVSYWGGDAKGVLKEKGGLVVFGCAIGRMHTPIECRRRSLVGPDARREFARVSPTAVRYLPLYLYRQRKLDLIPRWYSSLACWFSFDHCPLPFPTQPPSLPHPPSLSSTHSQSFFLLFRHYRATAPRILYPLSSTVGANLFELSSFRHQQGYSHETESTKCWNSPTAFTFLHVLRAPLRFFLNTQDSLVLHRVCTSPVQHVDTER